MLYNQGLEASSRRIVCTNSKFDSFLGHKIRLQRAEVSHDDWPSRDISEVHQRAKRKVFKRQPRTKKSWDGKIQSVLRLNFFNLLYQISPRVKIKKGSMHWWTITAPAISLIHACICMRAATFNNATQVVAKMMESCHWSCSLNNRFSSMCCIQGRNKSSRTLR